MVFIMKHINYILLLILISFPYALLLTTNSPLTIQTQSWVYATSAEQQDDNQEEAQSSSENEDSPDEANSESESSQGTTDSDQSDNNSRGNDDDISSTNQNTACPNITELSNVPTFIAQDGCEYPCPLPDSVDQSNIPQGCPVESPSQTTTGFVINEEQPIQLQQPLQTSTNEPQENTQPNPNQNTFVNPRINSDTASDISTNGETITTQKTFNPASQFKPGSGQTELTIPGKSDGVARPYTPGAASDRVVGIPTQPNINPQTPIDPGNIPTTIPDRAYLTVITKMMNFYTGYLKVSDFEICVQTTVQTDGKSRTVDAIPRCANGSASGVQYTVQAPGSITIWVDNLDELGVRSFMIETPNLSNYINAHESKTSTIYISPYQSQGP